MPSQGHLYIGRRVAAEADVRAIALAVGADPAKVADNADLLTEGWHEAAALGIPEREVLPGDKYF